MWRISAGSLLPRKIARKRRDTREIASPRERLGDSRLRVSLDQSAHGRHISQHLLKLSEDSSTSNVLKSEKTIVAEALNGRAAISKILARAKAISTTTTISTSDCCRVIRREHLPSSSVPSVVVRENWSWPLQKCRRLPYICG